MGTEVVRESNPLASENLPFSTMVAFGQNLKRGLMSQGVRGVREGNSLASEKTVPWHHGSLWSKFEKRPLVPRGQSLSEKVILLPPKNLSFGTTVAFSQNSGSGLMSRGDRGSQRG